MSTPSEFYVIMPPGALKRIHTMLRGKVATDITEKSKERVKEFLLERGEWTDESQFKQHKQRRFIYFGVDGIDRVIIERDE